MTRRKKITIIVSSILLLGLISGAIIYYKKHNVKADATSSVVNYYGYVTWSDGTPAAGKAISIANRQSIVRSDGQYTFYLSKSDFDHGTVNSSAGAPLAFYDPSTFEQYNEADRLTPSSLLMPTNQTVTYTAMSFVLDKPYVAPANNFAVIGAPLSGNKTVSFRFSFANPTTVSLDIKGRSGQSVRTMSQSFASGPNGSIVWDGKDSAGRPVQAGVYMVTISASDGLNTPVILPAGQITLR